MTAAEARYFRASRQAHARWANSQPQFVIPGVLDEAEPCALGLVEPADHTSHRRGHGGLDPGAEPSHATFTELTAETLPRLEQFPVAPPAQSSGSAPQPTTTETGANLTQRSRARLQKGA